MVQVSLPLRSVQFLGKGKNTLILWKLWAAGSHFQIFMYADCKDLQGFLQYQIILMSFNNKRQSTSKRWILNKTRLSTKPRPGAYPYIKSPYQKALTKPFSKSLPKTNTQKHHYIPPAHNPSAFLTSQHLPQPFSSLHKISECPQQHHETLDLDLLQNKIDKLLKQKLRILIEFNKHKAISKTKDIPFNFLTVQSLLKINEELEGLIVKVRTNIQGSQSGKNIQKWKFLDKKIKMLEKVLAENYSEVEVMKKFYTKVSQSGTSYKMFCKDRDQSRVNKVENRHLQLSNQRAATSLSPTARLPSISETKVQFKTPSQKFNKLNKSLANYKTIESQKNRHQTIIQTSAYKRSYPRYPKFQDVQMTQRHCSLPFNPFTTKKGSCYKNDYILPYKSKQEEVNYKKLDCYRNKIKSVNLNYSHVSDQSNAKTENEEYFKMNHSINKALTQPDVVLTSGIMNAVNPFTPVGEGDEKLYRARPKNNRLEALKSSFRSFITLE